MSSEVAYICPELSLSLGGLDTQRQRVHRKAGDLGINSTLPLAFQSVLSPQTVQTFASSIRLGLSLILSTQQLPPFADTQVGKKEEEKIMWTPKRSTSEGLFGPPCPRPTREEKRELLLAATRAMA